MASTSDDFHMPDGAPEPEVRAQDDEVNAPLSIVSFLEEFALLGRPCKKQLSGEYSKGKICSNIKT